MAVNNQCNDGYGSFIKNLTLEKFLWCMKLDLGGELNLSCMKSRLLILFDIILSGYICIWLLLSEFITQFLMVLDSTVDKLSTDPVCSQQKLPNIELFNVTTDSLIKLIMDNDKCMQAMMETKMELLFIRAAVLLLMIFFGIKSTEGIEKVSFNSTYIII